MNLNKLLDFWNSRQPRERLLVTISAMVLIIFLVTLYIFSTINSISTKTKALESSKNDFNYVFSKAKNAIGYQKTQRAINESVSLEEFLINESNSLKLLKFNITDQNNKNVISFSHPVIQDISQFIEIVIVHQLVIIESIDINPLDDTYLVSIFFKKI